MLLPTAQTSLGPLPQTPLKMYLFSRTGVRTRRGRPPSSRTTDGPKPTAQPSPLGSRHSERRLFPWGRGFSQHGAGQADQVTGQNGECGQRLRGQPGNQSADDQQRQINGHAEQAVAQAAHRQAGAQQAAAEAEQQELV